MSEFSPTLVVPGFKIRNNSIYVVMHPTARLICYTYTKNARDNFKVSYNYQIPKFITTTVNINNRKYTQVKKKHTLYNKFQMRTSGFKRLGDCSFKIRSTFFFFSVYVLKPVPKFKLIKLFYLAIRSILWTNLASWARNSGGARNLQLMENCFKPHKTTPYHPLVHSLRINEHTYRKPSLNLGKSSFVLPATTKKKKAL